MNNESEMMAVFTTSGATQLRRVSHRECAADGSAIKVPEIVEGEIIIRALGMEAPLIVMGLHND